MFAEFWQAEKTTFLLSANLQEKMLLIVTLEIKLYLYVEMNSAHAIFFGRIFRSLFKKKNGVLEF